MILRTCGQCGIRFYAPESELKQTCWRCERRARVEQLKVAERLLEQVFPGGLPGDDGQAEAAG
jgi:hypothetical protein